MKRVVRNYVFWTYQRGSVHYDVMVTLILLFIFLSPRVINFHDRPEERTLPPSQLLVKSDGHSGLMYQVDTITLEKLHDVGDLKAQLYAAITPISGDVTIDRYEPVKGASGGKIIAYRVWAHRSR
ncbi:MAG: hypothetical protein WA708_07350 [Acidobacteriaceae bacterium]